MGQVQRLFSSESYYWGEMFVTHMKPQQNSQGCVLFLHGYPAAKQKNYDVAEVFALSGFDVFLPHYAGLGWSKGVFGFEKSRDEIAKLAREIKAQRPDCPLSVVGHSWGGLLAIQIADQIDGNLLLFAPLSYIPSEDSGDIENKNYSNLKNFTNFISSISPKNSAQYSFDKLYAEINRLRLDEENQIAWMMNHRITVTILHAPDDDVIPIRHSRDLVQKLSTGASSSSLIEVPHEDHSFGNDRAAFLGIIQSLVPKR